MYQGVTTARATSAPSPAPPLISFHHALGRRWWTSHTNPGTANPTGPFVHIAAPESSPATKYAPSFVAPWAWPAE